MATLRLFTSIFKHCFALSAYMPFDLEPLSTVQIV